jgi:hypothetical protein
MMAAESHDMAGSPPVARLVIRDPSAARSGAWLQALRRLSAAWSARRLGRPTAPVRLQINDLKGCQFYASEHPCAPIELALPPGIYDVNVGVDGMERRYTVALECGATFQLDVRMSVECG